ncbi:T9SS type A sorting domain-containing protein [Crocinitomicaceae bacterium]|nr:T9SS type A sorting domain-containing protein [Crocinitomicaceae bacterium]
MKKITLAVLAVSFLGTASAQIFSDDFESYALGSYIGPQSTEWRTWSATGEGTAEDAQTTNNQASSGTQSVYFSSTSANGGPQDVVLDFGVMYTTGVFSYASDFYVNAGKTAYFNFQGNNTIGGLYALDVYMDGGSLTFQSGGANVLTTAYPEATWFTLAVECNLTTGIWNVKINGVSEGNWLNAVNSVRYLDLYPILNSQFWVDDVSFDHSAYTLSSLNAAAGTLNMGGGIAGQVANPSLVVVNAGTTAITSFDVNLIYNGSILTENVTGVNIASLGNSTVNFSNLTLIAGSNSAVATISNVNGGTDDVASDDVSLLTVNPVVPAAGKVVVGEEGTGTWCQWCPRGAVFMDRFANDYGPFWAGVAVHNGDPMVVDPYDTGMNLSGYPGAKVDRVGAAIDPSAMQTPFLTRLQTAPTAFIEVGALFDATTGELKISGDFNFQVAATNGYKAVFVLTEDGVTGGTGYAQANAYAGGGQGSMGGYELLPSPVPASQMVYDHVARIIEPSFGGFAGSFPTTIPAMSNHAVNHTIMIPSTWNADSLHIIVMLVDPNGQIDNAGQASIASAVSNGYVIGTATSGVGLTEINHIDATFKMYPNPATTQVALTFNLKNESDVAIRVIDMAGKVLASRAYDSMNGSSSINYNTSDLKPGIYMVEVTINGERLTRQLVIK